MGKALRMRPPSRVESCGTLLDPRLRETVVHVMWGEQTESRMVMVVIVPSKEIAAGAARVFQRPEALREAGPILQSFEMRLGVRIVIGDVRP